MLSGPVVGFAGHSRRLVGIPFSGTIIMACWRAASVAVSLASCLLVFPGSSVAEDFYCYRRVRELKTFEDILPDGSRPAAAPEVDDSGSGSYQGIMKSYGSLTGEGELVIDAAPVPDQEGGVGPKLGKLREHAIVAIRLPRAPEGDVVSGWLYVPREDGRGMKPVKFFLNTKPLPPDAKAVFAATRRSHYERWTNSGVPGSAWFQHQVRASRRLAADPKDPEDSTTPPTAARDSTSDAERLYALFSGGRAINENLQLDRMLRPGAANPSRPGESESVRVDRLAGITVAEIDWKPLTAGKEALRDEGVRFVPHDQHALFMPGVKGAEALVAEAASGSAPIWKVLGVDNQFKSVLARYERQLGIGLGELSKFPGAAAIRGIILTGSDPYFVSGTDVALIFKTDAPNDLAAYLRERLEGACKASEKPVPIVTGETADVATTSARDDGRRISCYIGSVKDAVILANSPVQLETILATDRGEKRSLAEMPEYEYFRMKYRRPDDKEAAFLVLSDATIRRWCGPRWRIGSSRRIRAAAGLAAIQADQLAETAPGDLASRPLPASVSPILGVDLGELSVTRRGVRSKTFGTLEFQTPIAELPLETVSKAEAGSYEVWRDGYQRNWRGTFDPIAVRLRIDPGKPRRLGLDLTVTPLIASTDYRDMIKLIGGASFGATAGDPHPEALIHAIMAVDVKSDLMQSGGAQLMGMTNLPKEAVLGWVGDSASLYVDDSPIWKEFSRAGSSFRFAEDHFSQLPIALHVAVTDGLKLALFLGGVRAFGEQSAPGLTKWENLDYKGRKYVRISEQPTARPDLAPGKERFALYYAPTSRSIVVSPNEALIKRFLDRQDRDARPEGGGADPAEGSRPGAQPEWLGRNIGLRLNAKGMQLLNGPALAGSRNQLSVQSWANLPILNEWHRLFPDRDPVKFHEEVWGERLACPAGGEYVWDARWQSMKSTAVGLPAEPKTGPDVPSPWLEIGKVDLGIDFEDGGLRGRAEVEAIDRP